MNKDKILDEMFEYFEGTRDNFDIDMVEEFLESYEPQETLIQDIHERLTRIENRKEILLSALKSNNEDREELACFFVDTNALDFFSVDEINRLLNSNELKNSPLEKVRGSLIGASGNIEKYLAPESVKTHKLTGKSILFILGVKVLDNNVPELDNMIDNDQYTSETAFNLIKICNLIRQSNSGKLNRIASNVLMNILTKPVDEQLDMAKKILKIYETNDIPEFAKDFMVFATLNSAFLEGTESKGNIPSLNRATPTQRKNIIFSDLLRISIESNNRNLREYLNNIEQGDKLFEMFKAGNLQIDSTLPEESRVILKKYCNMLNTMYNQTSRGRRLDNARINSGNLAQDLTELNDLFTNEENIHIPLRDRIVRTFGYWAGIRSFEQAKK